MAQIYLDDEKLIINGTYNESYDPDLIMLNTGVQVGDEYLGGYVYYLNEEKNWGMIVAPERLTGSFRTYEFGCRYTSIPITNFIYQGAYTDIGSGLTYTTAILSGCAERPIASSIATTYGDGSWHLPGISELNEMNIFFVNFPDIFIGGSYHQGYPTASSNQWDSSTTYHWTWDLHKNFDDNTCMSGNFIQLEKKDCSDILYINVIPIKYFTQ